MRELFSDILDQDDVQGVMLFSFDGELVFKEFSVRPPEEPESQDWWAFLVRSLEKANEVEAVFERHRLYIRRTELGYLLVLMGFYAPAAMVRLNCDILLPRLKGETPARGLGRFFRRKL